MRYHSALSKFQLVTLVLLLGVIITPLLSTRIPFPRTELAGMQSYYPFPKPSFVQLKRGKYQKSAEVWALRTHPLWGWSVRLMNQLVYELTGEISLDYGTSVQGGRDGYLWQPMYLRSFNRKDPAPKRKIYATFRDLKLAQTALAQHSIPLISVINPNIIALYPELLPTKYLAMNPRDSSYDVTQRAIEEFKPRVLDTFRYLKESSEHYPFRFFSPTGSHWNDIGSCLAARLVSLELAQSWGEAPPSLECEKWQMEPEPREPEKDLLEISNLLLPHKLYASTPYLINHPEAQFRKPRKILLIGTSFLFGLEKQLLKHRIADSTLLLFYFRSSRRNGKGSFHPFDRRQLTKELLLSYDAVIVDANVAGPGAMGYSALRVITSALGGANTQPTSKQGARPRSK